MSTVIETGNAPVKNKVKDTRLSRFERELEAIEPKRRHHEDALFSDAYPSIEQSLARKVPQKTIIEKFNAAFGAKLHPVRFRQLLCAERERRAASGDLVMCKACGHSIGAVEPPDPATNLSSADSSFSE